MSSSSRHPVMPDTLHIAVEGVIGVGKTTLAKSLAKRMGAIYHAEDKLENPYLAKFYKNKEAYALAAQLHFLDRRCQQFSAGGLGGLAQVADHSLIKDRLFAELNLNEEDFQLYERMAKVRSARCSFNPNVLVFLSASFEEIVNRIRERGRKMERAIEVDYLKSLYAAYDQFLTSRAAQQLAIVVIDLDSADIHNDNAALQRVIEACRGAKRGVQYCNPIA